MIVIIRTVKGQLIDKATCTVCYEIESAKQHLISILPKEIRKIITFPEGSTDYTCCDILCKSTELNGEYSWYDANCLGLDRLIEVAESLADIDWADEQRKDAINLIESHCVK